MNNLVPVEFNRQRIMTTEVLAQSFGTESKIISNNFNRNIERFEEGRHFYKLQGENLKQFKGIHLNDESLKYVSTLYLWTEKGAARHAKILDTDEAWQVYEELEETYFRVKENKPACVEDLIIMQAQSLKDLRLQINQVNALVLKSKVENEAVKEEVQAIREVITISPSAWKNEVSNLLNKIAKQRGGTAEAYREVRDESYKLLDERAGANLNVRLTNKRRRMAEEGVCKSKRDKLNKIDVIAEDKKLTEVYLAIVKDMAIRYGVQRRGV